MSFTYNNATTITIGKVLSCEIKHFNSYMKCVITGQPRVKIHRTFEKNIQMKVKS